MNIHRSSVSVFIDNHEIIMIAFTDQYVYLFVCFAIIKNRKEKKKRKKIEENKTKHQKKNIQEPNSTRNSNRFDMEKKKIPGQTFVFWLTIDRLVSFILSNHFEINIKTRTTERGRNRSNQSNSLVWFGFVCSQKKKEIHSMKNKNEKKINFFFLAK